MQPRLFGSSHNVYSDSFHSRYGFEMVSARQSRFVPTHSSHRGEEPPIRPAAKWYPSVMQRDSLTGIISHKVSS